MLGAGETCRLQDSPEPNELRSSRRSPSSQAPCGAILGGESLSRRAAQKPRRLIRAQAAVVVARPVVRAVALTVVVCEAVSVADTAAAERGGGGENRVGGGGGGGGGGAVEAVDLLADLAEVMVVDDTGVGDHELRPISPRLQERPLGVKPERSTTANIECNTFSQWP